MKSLLIYASLMVGLAVRPGCAWAQGNDADLGDFSNVPAGDSTVTIAVPATPYPVGGVVRYFSPGGSNTTGNGLTPATAWRTLTQALADDATKIPTSATLVFAAGLYSVDSVRINRAVTLQPAAGARAWFVGSEPLPDARWERVGTGNVWRTTAAQPWTVRFSNELQNNPQTIIGNCPGGGTSTDHTACPPSATSLRAGYRDQVFVDGKPLLQVFSQAAVVGNTFFVDVANSRIYMGRNPVGRLVEASALETALVVAAPGQAPNQRVVVRGLGFRHFASAALRSFGGNLELDGCTFAWSATEGASVGVNVNNVVIKNNTFSYNGRLGLAMGIGPVAGQVLTNLLVEGNVFSYNNHEGFAMYWSAGGLKIVRFDGVVVRGNLFDRNYGTGLWCDLDVERLQVLGNIARNNQAIGLFYEVSRGGLLAGNVAYGNGSGIKISGSSGAAVVNNTLVDNTVNLEVSDNSRLNNDPNVPANVLAAQNARGINYETYEVTVRNNVLANGRKANLVVSQQLSNPEQGIMINPGALNHNLYLRWSPQTAPTPSTPGQYFMAHFNNLGSVPANGPVQKYATLAAFQAAVNPAGTTAATGFEVNGTEVSSQPVANLFANAAAQDYRLKDCPANWALPAADPLTSGLVVAAAVGPAPAYTFTPAEFRAALGLAAGAPLRVGGLQQAVGCAGPLAAAAAAPADAGWELYPNPAQGELHLRLANEHADEATLVLRNSVGQEVLRLTQAVSARGALLVPVGQLAPGLYWAMLLMRGSEERATKALLIRP